MRKTKLITFIIILLSLCKFTSNGQSYNPKLMINNSSSNGYITYTTTDAAPKTARFLLMGDGFFSTNESGNHQFPNNTGGYSMKAFFNEAYDTNPPILRTQPTGTTGTGTTTNPTINLIGNTRIGCSWSSCKNIENYFLLIFENNSITDTTQGCIEFYYDKNQLKLNTSGILTNNWVDNRSITNVTGSSLYNRKIKWDFNNLLPHEQRVVYIPMTSIVNKGTKLKLGSKYNVNCNSSSSSISNTSFNTAGSPHDPNTKEVTPTCLDQNLVAPQTLTYTVKFQNEGNSPVINVHLEDLLDFQYLDLNSLVFLESEYPFNYYFDQNMLIIDFTNINLPGLKQQVPHIYTYDETESYIKFQICTYPNLPNNICIDNMVDIFFDNLSPITTNIAQTCMTEELCNAVNCNIPATPKISNTNTSISSNIILTPNPFNDKIYVSGINENNITIKIFNNYGQQVKTILSSGSGNDELSVDYLPKGLYYISILNQNVKKIQKMIKY